MLKGVQINYSMSNGEKIAQVAEDLATVEEAKEYVDNLLRNSGFVDIHPNPHEGYLDAILIKTSEVISYSISLLNRE